MRQVTKSAPTLRPSARWPRPARLFLGLALILLALAPHAAASGGSAQNSSATADRVAVKYDGITYLPITYRSDETVYVPEPFTPQNVADQIYKGKNELIDAVLGAIEYDNSIIGKQTTIKEIRPMLTKTQYVEYLVDVYRKTAEGKDGLPSTKEELEEWFKKYGPILYGMVGVGEPNIITTYEGKQITLITPINEIEPTYIWGMAARKRTETSEVVEVGITYMINEVGTAIKQITLKTNNRKPEYGKREEKYLKRNRVEGIFWDVEEMRGYRGKDSGKIAASSFDGVAYIPIGIIEINGIGYAFPTAPIMYDIRPLGKE